MARGGDFAGVAGSLRAAAGNGGEGTAGAGVRRRVLLVEDNRNLRVTTSRMLEHLGFDVIAVPGGVEALAAFRGPGPRPDVVVLDALLSGTTGGSVLRSLRELAPGVPVVMCSGSPDELSRAAAEGGVAAVLGKPYDLATLAATLRRAMGDRSS